MANKIIVTIGCLVVWVISWLALKYGAQWVAKETGRDLANLAHLGGAIWALAIYRPMVKKFLP